MTALRVLNLTRSALNVMLNASELYLQFLLLFRKIAKTSCYCQRIGLFPIRLQCWWFRNVRAGQMRRALTREDLDPVHLVERCFRIHKTCRGLCSASPNPSKPDSRSDLSPCSIAKSPCASICRERKCPWSSSSSGIHASYHADTLAQKHSAAVHTLL